MVCNLPLPIPHGNRMLRHSSCRQKYRKEYNRQNASNYYGRYQEKQRRQIKKYRQQLRKEILEAYGNKCACCDESHPEFLAVDHINGGGNQHKKQLGISGGLGFYRWLKQQDFPKEDFQILCHNCNLSKAFYGYCPHNKSAGMPKGGTQNC